MSHKLARILLILFGIVPTTSLVVLKLFVTEVANKITWIGAFAPFFVFVLITLFIYAYWFVRAMRVK